MRRHIAVVIHPGFQPIDAAGPQRHSRLRSVPRRGLYALAGKKPREHDERRRAQGDKRIGPEPGQGLWPLALKPDRGTQLVHTEVDGGLSMPLDMQRPQAGF
jgi:hypothetical protein